MKRIVPAFAAIACLLGGPGFGLTAESARGAESLRAADQVAYEKSLQFRRAAGLNTDPDYVRASVLDSSQFPNMESGVPLTAAEGAEIARRVSVQDRMGPALEWASGQPDFGGAYLDQPSGGVPVLQVAGDPADFGARLDTRLPAGVAARVIAVQNTQVSLTSLKYKIWAERERLRDLGIDLQSVALDTKENRVAIEVEGLTAQASLLLRQLYGDIGITENVAGHLDAGCVSRANCAPMKGGLLITDVNHTAYQCTSGFNVREGTSMRVLTAGHCLLAGLPVLADPWKHNGVQFGTGKVSTWSANATADAGLISLGAISGPDNLVYALSATDIRDVRGWRAISGQTVDSYVCRYGAKSGYYCGYVIQIDRLKDVEGINIDHQWVVGVDAIPGDSGAPYVVTSSGVSTAWGIHSDSTDANPPGGSGWYSPIPYVQSTLAAKNHPIIFCTDQYCGL